jgi:hypothetical protein
MTLLGVLEEKVAARLQEPSQSVASLNVVVILATLCFLIHNDFTRLNFISHHVGLLIAVRVFVYSASN